MNEGLFSIFPDPHPSLGSADTDGWHSSQKKALRDVKNTFEAHRALLKPSGKVYVSNANGQSDSLAVNHCSMPTASVTVHSDNDVDLFWDSCKCCKDQGDDHPVRLHEECLNKDDIKYLMEGVFSLPNFDCSAPEHIAELSDIGDTLGDIQLQIDFWVPSLDWEPLHCIDLGED